MNKLPIIIFAFITAFILEGCSKEGSNSSFYTQTDVTVSPENYILQSNRETALKKPQVLSYIANIQSPKSRIISHENLLIVFDYGSRILKIYDTNKEKLLRSHDIRGEWNAHIGKTEHDVFLITKKKINKILNDGELKTFDNYFGTSDITGSDEYIYLLCFYGNKKELYLKIVKCDQNLIKISERVVKRGHIRKSTFMSSGFDLVSDPNNLYLIYKYQNRIDSFNLDLEFKETRKILSENSIEAREIFNNNQFHESANARGGRALILLDIGKKYEHHNNMIFTLVPNPDNKHKLLIFNSPSSYRIYNFQQHKNILPAGFTFSESGKKVYVLNSISDNQHQILSFNLEVD